jgi:hypothetical protein
MKCRADNGVFVESSLMLPEEYMKTQTNVKAGYTLNIGVGQVSINSVNVGNANVGNGQINFNLGGGEKG